ncbi:MAG: sodium-translocating pyrophosphatase [Bifidobacteriaceae bacterium]|jgi:K(+)-stimulated pyrophosphate-energized sodium pump|nr:sodium-translocating pyrophosphatase [Bifidobacteriaceae bacterium]
MMDKLIYLAPISGTISIIFAVFLAYRVLSQDPGSKEMKDISKSIQEGAKAYLNRQYKTITIAAIILSVLIAALLPQEDFNSVKIALCFLVGALFSGAAGYIGMNVSVRANVRTAQAAKTSLKKALDTAFKGGAVTGLAVVGLSMLGVSLLFIIFKDIELVIGFGFGASLISLFARVGGGIYTKAADVGADIVGKVEAGIPEDDPRNPATIADNVGDNVGDCAGMGADLFETYAVTLIASIMLGITVKDSFPQTFPSLGSIQQTVLYPLMLGSVAIIASVVAVFCVRLGKKNKIMSALYKGVAAASVLSLMGFFVITYKVLGKAHLNFFYVTIIGVAITVLMVIFTEYYTSTEHRPVKLIRKSSETGPATNIISGLAMGFESTILPVLTIVIGIIAAFFVAAGPNLDPGMGLYGISIAAVAMLSTTGIIVALDSYGPITDNAGGIAEMSSQPESLRKITDELDAVGNTTKAVTKGYAIGSAALGALALFADYHAKIDELLPHKLVLDNRLFDLPVKDAAYGGNAIMSNGLNLAISSPLLLVGLLIGGLLPFAFTSVTMQAVSKAASKVVDEVRRQFKAMPGILKGTQKPEYAKCVDIVTSAALKEMIIPGLLAILTPLIVGVILGPAALAGVLIGIIVVGLMLANSLNNAGGAWDNAKKLVEMDGKKGSEVHLAAIVGDTVGDPTKDTSGPALNALIKVVNMVAILFAPLYATGGLISHFF